MISVVSPHTVASLTSRLYKREQPRACPLGITVQTCSPVPISAISVDPVRLFDSERFALPLTESLC